MIRAVLLTLLIGGVVASKPGGLSWDCNNQWELYKENTGLENMLEPDC